MCGRYTQKAKAPELTQAFALTEPPELDLQESYNAAPTQTLPVIPNATGGARVVAPFRWGLVPFWAKDIKIGSRLINARAEGIATKPSFRAAYKYRRCLIPTTGFYEWKREGKGNPKRPMFITMRGDEPFAFGGLWERWKSPGGDLLHTFTIITTEPNGLIAQLHNRMPVIIRREDFDTWLDVDLTDRAVLDPLLAPIDPGNMVAWEVSTRVNNVRNDDADLTAPVDGGLKLGM